MKLLQRIRQILYPNKQTEDFIDEPQGDLEQGVFRRHDCIPDISVYQRNVDFDVLCANTDFVIMRARCCGSNDAVFESRAIELNKRDMPFAVYDYTRLSSCEDARYQAEAFYKLASPYNPRIYYIDTENPANGVSYKDEIEYIKAYVGRLRELGAEKVGHYSGDWRYSTYYFEIADIFDTLWIARYGTDSGELEDTVLKIAKKAKNVDLHQYTSKGIVPGIETKCDISVLTGSRDLEWFTGRKYE